MLKKKMRCQQIHALDLQENEEEKEIPIGKILAFFTGFLILVFIALVISNLSGTLGGTKILDGNIQALFDHQTVPEDSNGGNIQTANNDFQTNMQMHVKKSLSGIDNIVPISKWSDCVDVDIQDGSMQIVDENLPSELPLCIDQAWIDAGNYYVDVYSYGGYMFSSEDYAVHKLYITQGKDTAKESRYYLDINWASVTNEYPKDCCADEWYRATFSIPLDEYTDDKICLDAKNWPTIPGFYSARFDCQYEEIPGKDVCYSFETDWAGCPYWNQHFEILSV
ncbi:MAG: hypothetical protein ACXADY_23760 [Candidatus Hodarchaeales archaeon]|jgi:hypothetical protein